MGQKLRIIAISRLAIFLREKNWTAKNAKIFLKTVCGISDEGQKKKGFHFDNTQISAGSMRFVYYKTLLIEGFKVDQKKGFHFGNPQTSWVWSVKCYVSILQHKVVIVKQNILAG